MPVFLRGPWPLPAGSGFSLPSLGSEGSASFGPYSRVGVPVNPSRVVAMAYTMMKVTLFSGDSVSAGTVKCPRPPDRA